ncbi:MAG: ExeM/NucH family extracellular endonuclease, partial [Candidatus Promineifilaceae bacterium]
MKTKIPLLALTAVLLLVAMLLAGSAVPQAQAAPTAIAYDMVGSSSQNLISYTDDPAIPFSSAADGFQKYQRGVSSSIPYAVLDDSLVTYPPDNLGIIDDTNLDEFFGVTDTVNGDTSGPVTATWVFNISGAENLSLSIDMGAMGDFESSDVFTWEYQIDGGPVQTAFVNSVDEAGSYTYTLAGGSSFTLNDPMLVDGLILSNILQTLTTNLTGSGSQLTLTLTAETDGGSEAFAFQNIVINGTVAPTAIAYDMVGSSSQNLISYTDDPAIPFSSAADGFQKYQRGVSSSIPYAVLDDSLVTYPPDNLGIIDDTNLDEFFGVTDTVNGDTSGPVTATWVFNISGAENLSLSIDMGAMGDFESSDVFTWEYQIDGGPVQTAFVNSVDEAGSYTYTLAGGSSFTLNDPMLVDGLILSNILQTLTTNLTGSGSQLTLTLTAETDGGSEAFAFQNIVISGISAGNVPPVVVSTNPGGGAEYVTVDSNIEIAFNENVTVTDPWFEINCGGAFVDAVVGGGPASYTLDPVSDLPSTTVCTVTVFAGAVADQGDPPLNMEEDYQFSFTTNAVCSDPSTAINAVQGPGFVSPIVGQLVTVEGVVVGDFQESDELDGFFVQEEDADFDNDPATSEGVFVNEGGFAAPDVQDGDLVRVTGTVVENFMNTEIAVVDVLVCDYAPGAYGPVDVTLPETTDGDLEKVEGMYVDLTNTMSVAQNYFLGRYGQLTLSSDLTNRLFQPTNQELPYSPEAAALAEYNNLNLLFLDDGMEVSSCGDNPDPVPYLGGPPPAVLRGGDMVNGLVGVIDYGQINSGSDCSDPATVGRDYRLQPTQDPNFIEDNPRTAVPDDVGGSLKVVSFNVLNFFNGDGQGGGFPTSRGAYTFLEFVRQRIKIYEAMKAIDGDVVGVMEIENDGFDQYSAIAELVTVMNEGPCYNSPDECAGIGYTDPGLGAGTYAYVDAGPGVVGTDEITVGFIYKPASVTPFGDPVIVDDPDFTNPMDYVDEDGEFAQQSRPAIAQTFMSNEDGALFTPIVNHLKSKGSSCGPGDDDLEQGSCNLTRTLGAQYLVETAVPQIQASSGDPDVIIIGDLNSYAMEDPIRVLTDGGFTNLVKSFSGDYAYTYTFDGLVGYLDHSLANASLTPQVTGVTEWHINTDEPAV